MFVKKFKRYVLFAGLSGLGVLIYKVLKQGEKSSSSPGAGFRVQRGASSAGLAVRTASRSAVYGAKKLVSNKEDTLKLDEEFALKTTEDVVKTLGGMKGAMMKLGQLASFVDDGLPDSVKEMLTELQADAPPMSQDLALKVIEDELGEKVKNVFKDIDLTPIAAASIGQVHRAITKDGEEVVVKVQYPQIGETILADLANIDLAGLITPFVWKGLDLKSLTEELRTRLMEEVDYENEAINQQLFYSFYEGHPFIKVPKVYPELSTKRLLVTEYVEGVKFKALSELDQHQKDLAAESIYRFAFRSLYRLKSFNGDPHPGNYLFNKDGRVCFLDFGLVKHFDENDLSLLFDIIKYSVIDPDLKLQRKAVEKAGFLVPDAPVDDEDVAQFMEVFMALVSKDEPLTLTTEYTSEVSRRVIFGRASHASVVTYANIPATFALLQRINLGLLAILGTLNATANWRSISEEMWTQTDSEPRSELGLLEREWWRQARKRLES